jgi:hypothetical protein
MVLMRIRIEQANPVLAPYQIEKQNPDLYQSGKPDSYQKGLDPEHCHQRKI